MQVFIWDSIGELGIVYRLSSYVIIGGSFIPKGGGHNPIEAIECGCLPIHGFYIHNFKDLYSDLDHVGAAIKIEDSLGLQILLKKMHIDEVDMQPLITLGHDIIQVNKGAVERTLTYLHPFLER